MLSTPTVFRWAFAPCDEAPGGSVSGIDLGFGLSAEPGAAAYAGQSYTFVANYADFNPFSWF